MVVYLIIFFVLFFIDQYSKYVALKNIGFFKKIISLKRIKFILAKNNGIFLNIFAGKRIFILIMNITVMIIIFIYFKEVRVKYEILQNIGLSFIFAGGIGNIADRILRGYVVDFITFEIKRCPIFNMADFYIFIGIILEMITV